jgi:6-phosphogluconolactonase
MVDARQAGLLMRVRRLRDSEAVARCAAEATAEALRSAIAERGVLTIALAGGDTPRRMYEQLAAARDLDWDRVEFFWGDERPVPPDHPDSNFGMAHAALVRPLGIDPRRIHRIEAERSDLDAAAREYEQELAKTCGAPDEGPPILDLVLLGMGPDGHTASLFPHTAALSETRRWVVANDVPQLSTRRITITFPLIERARATLVLVTGASKSDALAEVLEGPLDSQRLPSQRLRGSANVEWLVDAAAASRLRSAELGES